ncbi:MAG: tRNA (adenosine(37)-N6)-dimethylallyltransferase MiaA, partial [Propionibacteriales bacterium]|nr:tRNA (adenosine(37)-N6)-dimethylallyltransferase MiaA [Propionibacteriales bacterium]
FERVVQIGIEVPRDVIDERIALRVDGMWRAGFVDEVRRLDRGGLRAGRTASRALGYRQVLDMLAGEADDAAARSETVRLTRRFARRQAAWFRRDPRIQWLPYDTADLTTRAFDAVRSIG